MRLVALAGGTGAAKLLRGLDALLERGAMTAVGNTRDHAVVGPAGWLGFQEYFVREKTQVEVRAVEYAGAPGARPAPGLVEAIGAADAVLVCPSNPVTSVGPILAVPGIVEALHGTRAPVLA